jgi:peptide/nickel transport system ATP-binding protein
MLDASTRMDVLNLLADLKSRGLSILFITHDLSLGYYLSDKSVILYRGSVAEMGSTVKIYQHPAHPYTQMLMNSVPRMDMKWAAAGVDLQAKQGESDTGCVYSARCPLADQRCGQTPPSVEVEEGHFAACWNNSEGDLSKPRLST